MNRAECLRTLGIRSGSSDAEARVAYRDLVKVWHPDRFDHDPDLRRRAERKLQQINLAWETLRSAEGRHATQPPPRQASRPAARSVRRRSVFPLLRLVTLVLPAIAIVAIAIWNAGRFDRVWSEIAGSLPEANEQAGESTPTEQAIRQVVSALSDRRFIRAGVVDVKRRPADDAEEVGSVSLDEVLVTEDEVFGWHRIVSLAEPSQTIGWARVQDVDTLEEIGLLDRKAPPIDPPSPPPSQLIVTDAEPSIRNVDEDPYELEFVRHGSSGALADAGRLPVAEHRDAERSCSERHYPGTEAYRDCVETFVSRLSQSSIAMAGFARAERRAIERECMAIPDATGFAACLRERIRARTANADHLAGLAPVERASLREVCASSLAAGEAPYEACLEGQLSRLDDIAPFPDLDALGASDRVALEAACAVSYTRGPSAYRRCAHHQLAVALRSSRRPDLASLDPTTRETLEAACSLEVHRGSEAHNACLWREFRAAVEPRPGHAPTRGR